MGTV